MSRGLQVPGMSIDIFAPEVLKGSSEFVKVPIMGTSHMGTL